MELRPKMFKKLIERLFGKKEVKEKENLAKRVEIKNLSLEELASSKMPDDKFDIWVHFYTPEGQEYCVIYSKNGKDENKTYYPRFSVSASLGEVPREEFDDIVKYLLNLNGGRMIPQRETYIDNGEISELIHEDKFPFTQKFISERVEEYRQKFVKVEITSAYYYDVRNVV
jgi:hypothetical protein